MDLRCCRAAAMLDKPHLPGARIIELREVKISTFASLFMNTPTCLGLEGFVVVVVVVFMNIHSHI